MLRDLEHSLARHWLAAQNVFQEWHDVVGAFGAAERDNQDGVVERQGIPNF
jgi:hypothetical protein